MSKFKKALAGVTIALVVIGVSASFAGAQTYSWTRPLKQGSTGADVMNLQKFLNLCADTVVSTSGAGSSGMETSYFGPATHAAVMKFQAKHGVSPVAGYFGPLSQAKAMSLQMSGNVCGSGVVTPNLPAGCTSTAGFSPLTGVSCSSGSTGGSTGGSLSGTDGTIEDINKITSYNDEEVGEGEDDVKVLGFEVETSNDGDVRIRSVKIVLDSTGNGGSTHLDDYISGVSVWMGSTKVGEADVDEFSEDDDVYTRVINLNGAVVQSDDSEDFFVSVDAVGNLDSGDISGDSWTIALENVRYEDGSGVVSTIDSGDTVIDGDIDYDAAGDGVEFDFVSFGDSADTELKISKDSDSPEDGIVIVDDSDETDGVVLLAGKLRLDGNSDVTIDELPVTFTVGGGHLLSNMASEVILVLDGEEYTETAATTAGGATGTITFDDLDFELGAGDSVDFEVRADINGTDEFAEGGSLLASITSDNRSAIDVENEEGDQVADADKTGTAIGEAQEFRSEGISLSLVSTDESVNADGTLGNYTIKFKVAAVGEDVYIGTTTTGKYVFAFEEASRGATTTGFSAAITNGGGDGNSTSTTSGGNWKINDGTSVTLTLQVFGNGASLSAGAYRAALSSMYWTISDTDAVTTTDNSYSSNMDEYKTDYEQIL